MGSELSERKIQKSSLFSGYPSQTSRIIACNDPTGLNYTSKFKPKKYLSSFRLLIATTSVYIDSKTISCS